MKCSAVLCTYNEDLWLEECLKSLQWCDEIVVCDMGSSDNSVSIAEKYASKVVSIPKVPYIELIREEAALYTENDWILFSDPDFIFPAEHIDEIKEKITSSPEITCVNMLYHNYYGNHEIKHGKWKPSNRYPIMFRRDAMKLPKLLHNGFNLTKGEKYTPQYPVVLKHMWISSEEQFYAKHYRYIANEGVRRIEKKQAPSSYTLLKYATKSLRRFLFGGITEGAIGWDLTKKDIWYEAEALRRHRLELLTCRNTTSDALSEQSREVHLYYNYYRDNNPERAAEIDYCFERLIQNSYITKVHVISDVELPSTNEKVQLLDVDIPRPSFADIFSLISKMSNEDSVNIYLNSDCFLHDEDTKKLHRMNSSDAYCLGRYEIPRINPFIPWKYHKEVRQSPRRDMQDCWIFVGKPSEAMWLDFMPGTPGCDNRLAYEFHSAGYEVSNPINQIRVYHNHTTQLRRYTEKQRVDKPYHFPERV